MTVVQHKSKSSEYKHNADTQIKLIDVATCVGHKKQQIETARTNKPEISSQK